MVIEGEEVRAFAEVPRRDARKTRVWAEKADGTPVLEARASLGPDFGETLLEGRLKQMRPPQRLVILSDLHLGMKGAQDERVRMDPDQHMGALSRFRRSWPSLPRPRPVTQTRYRNLPSSAS